MASHLSCWSWLWTNISAVLSLPFSVASSVMCRETNASPASNSLQRASRTCMRSFFLALLACAHLRFCARLLSSSSGVISATVLPIALRSHMPVTVTRDSIMRAGKVMAGDE